MIQAIVYTSNTGNTAAYAELLGERTGVPVYPLSSARKKLSAGAQIIYMGWLMAGGVKGYKAAAKRYRVCAVCGVGMGGTGTQLDEVRKANGIPQSTALFTLQGGINLQKLHGVYRFMMNIACKAAGKGLSEKQERTPEEEDMLRMMQQNESRVSADNLAAVIAWYNER